MKHFKRKIFIKVFFFVLFYKNIIKCWAVRKIHADLQYDMSEHIRMTEKK